MEVKGKEKTKNRWSKALAKVLVSTFCVVSCATFEQEILATGGMNQVHVVDMDRWVPYTMGAQSPFPCVPAAYANNPEAASQAGTPQVPVFVMNATQYNDLYACCSAASQLADAAKEPFVIPAWGHKPITAVVIINVQADITEYMSHTVDDNVAIQINFNGHTVTFVQGECGDENNHYYTQSLLQTYGVLWLKGPGTVDGGKQAVVPRIDQDWGPHAAQNNALLSALKGGWLALTNLTLQNNAIVSAKLQAQSWHAGYGVLNKNSRCSCENCNFTNLAVCSNGQTDLNNCTHTHPWFGQINATTIPY
ncbi:MAG: hypothetical protein LBB04_01820 [Oscillospiraceae bacterium]|jgi:hypothetical protein|nr:hypothetical protein [Oscillospiraceae bacterium]